ncbi:MAG: hypothetical protein ACOC8E_01980 [Planctomycetota bacterium]
MLVLLAVLATGCLQIETHVKLHKDGSATVTERVQFCRRLLEAQDEADPKRNLAALLEKKTIQERVKHMGKGAKLVGHEVREAARGARECVSVIRIPNIADFQYVSPFFGKTDYGEQKKLVCKVYPLYKSSWTGTRAGYMEIRFTSASGRRGMPEPKRPAPAELQKYRDLGPVFADMMKGLRLTFVFECYAPAVVRRAPQRNARSRPHKAYLIDITGDDIGRGRAFFNVEEVMVDLLQKHINGPHVRGRAGGTEFRFADGGLHVMFRPSQHYFDRYFTGKTLDFGRHGKRKASVEKDGYHPERAAKEEGDTE